MRGAAMLVRRCFSSWPQEMLFFLLPLKTAVFTSISRCFRWPGTGWNMQEAESQSWTGKEAQSWKKAISLKLGQDQESACVPVHHTRSKAGLASAAAAEPATAAATAESAAAAGGWTSSAATDTNLQLTLIPFFLNHALPHVLYLAEMWDVFQAAKQQWRRGEWSPGWMKLIAVSSNLNCCLCLQGRPSPKRPLAAASNMQFIRLVVVLQCFW